MIKLDKEYLFAYRRFTIDDKVIGIRNDVVRYFSKAGIQSWLQHVKAEHPENFIEQLREALLTRMYETAIIEDAREKSPTEPSNSIAYVTLRNGEVKEVSADCVQLLGETELLKILEHREAYSHDVSEIEWIDLRKLYSRQGDPPKVKLEAGSKLVY
jgi:hypothetical protein